MPDQTTRLSIGFNHNILLLFFWCAASVMEVPAASSIVTLSYSSRFTEEVSAASPTLTDGWGDAQDNGFAHNNDDNDEKDGCGDMDLQPKLEPALTHI
jgi:hypothetical protein